MKTFEDYKIKNLQLKNKIVMAPMCMYSSDESGMVKDFHRTHYSSKAIGGVGLITLEATAVTPNGRISSNDLGIWSDEHIVGLKSIVTEVHSHDSKIGIQLAHAGRKCESSNDFIVAPSSIPFSEDYRVPLELSKEDIGLLVLDFQNAALRANEAGFDVIEIHAAHGYLIHEFLSPLTNKRTDAYGGSLENRTRFLKEILAGVQKVWPLNKPVFLRVSADDYILGGIDKIEMVNIINNIRPYIDLVHVSTGGLISVSFDLYPGYQVDHAETIKRECDIATIAVGLIKDYDHIEEILGNNRADLVALGRALLRDPNFVLNMAYANNIDIKYPEQFKRAYK